MRICPDSKDLINIIEKSDPCSADYLESFMRTGRHQIVLSFMTVVEISGPLIHKEARTNVIRLLNLIESMPHAFIHSSSIPRLELKGALKAFSNGREYHKINPYLDRFDEIVDFYAQPPTKIYLNYPLSEIVWDLYCFGALEGPDRYAEKLRQLFALDRGLPEKPNLKENFIRTIQRNLSLHKLQAPSQGIEAFASWVYKNPTRCPSERLGYEAYHKIVKNVTVVPKDSDMEDLLHLGCLPYVELMTVGRRFHAYILEAARSLGIYYETSTARTVRDILQRR